MGGCRTGCSRVRLTRQGRGLEDIWVGKWGKADQTSEGHTRLGKDRRAKDKVTDQQQ